MQKTTQRIELLSIGEVAQQAGVRPSALRYYESVGVLPLPERRSGQRRYEASILARIGSIQAAQKAGFSIQEIKVLLDSPEPESPYAERLQALAQRKLVGVEALIAHAQTAKQILEAGLKCRCLRLEDCPLFMKTGT